MISYFLAIMITAVTSLILVFLLRRYALNHNLLDHPNQRSSHVTVTPTGGGLAIIVAFYAGLFIATVTIDGMLRPSDGRLLALVGGVPVALVGLIDDHVRLSVRLRLLLHFAAAIWAVVWLGGWPVLSLGFADLHWDYLGSAIAIIGLVWLTNLFNFMDGTDGIAAAEAMFVCCGLAMLASFMDVFDIPVIILATSVFGFLVLNWPPARLFMGDVGSSFLGYMLGVLALGYVVILGLSPWSVLILLALFVADATYTLIHRGLRREKVWLAHRSHAYQRAARRFGSHRSVLLGSIAINLLWLLPCALLAETYREQSLILAVVAYAPLIALAHYFGAGNAESADG